MGARFAGADVKFRFAYGNKWRVAKHGWINKWRGDIYSTDKQ